MGAIPETLMGRKLCSVTRLAWVDPGEPLRLNVGPVHLTFDDGCGVVLSGNSDWTLGWEMTGPGDEGWLGSYDYDWNGAGWTPRDASVEGPFTCVVGYQLKAWEPLHNEVGEVVGVDLQLGEGHLVLKNWEGEVTT